MNITFDDLRNASKRIKPFIHRTPVVSSSALNARTGLDIVLKCENLQKVGAFKFRGACNAVFSLTDEQARYGVVAHSSGNHAQALALAARIRGIPAYIVMPENAPSVKKAAVADYGGIITFCTPTLSARETTQAEIVARTGACIIHPYDDDRIIAGQATAALELIDDCPDLDVILAPVGGGGLLSGTALAAAFASEKTKVIGVEPENADDAFRSFHAGSIIPSMSPLTIADGLLTSLGERNFPLIREYVDSILCISEQSIISATRFIWERCKLVIEPSAAVPVAALLDGKLNPSFRKIGVILSGGNVDLDSLPWQATSSSL
jgi:threonine dehydratase